MPGNGREEDRGPHGNVAADGRFDGALARPGHCSCNAPAGTQGERVMTRVLAAIGLTLALSACANVIEQPSYLGMATSSIDTGASAHAAIPAATPEAIRHVSSNKVLGAMAFKKVTGADVDPRTLSGSRQP